MIGIFDNLMTGLQKSREKRGEDMNAVVAEVLNDVPVTNKGPGHHANLVAVEVSKVSNDADFIADRISQGIHHLSAFQPKSVVIRLGGGNWSDPRDTGGTTDDGKALLR